MFPELFPSPHSAKDSNDPISTVSVEEYNELFVNNPVPDDVLCTLKDIRIKNIGRVIIATLNVNSLSHHIDALKTFIPENVDILVVTETKLDNSFQTAQFVIDGYKEPFRLDRNKNGGGVAIYVRDDIPCEQLHKHTFPSESYEFDNSKGLREYV